MQGNLLKVMELIKAYRDRLCARWGNKFIWTVKKCLTSQTIKIWMKPHFIIAWLEMHVCAHTYIHTYLISYWQGFRLIVMLSK